MIKEHIVYGSPGTTLHTFEVTQDGGTLKVSPGSYTQERVERFAAEEEAEINLAAPSTDTDYELWLTEEGLTLRSKTAGEVFADLTYPIDRLAWFRVTAGTDLADVEINVVRTVLTNED